MQKRLLGKEIAKTEKAASKNVAHDGESAEEDVTSAETKPNVGKDENAKPDIDRIKTVGLAFWRMLPSLR